MQFQPMATIGLISVACAIATVLGIALYIFGYARKARVMKISAILTFVLGFGGLIYILAKYGEKPEQAGSASATYWNVIKWTQTTDLGGDNIHIDDLTESWDGNLKIVVDGDRIKFGDGKSQWVQREFQATDSTWEFALDSTPGGPPLTGTFKIQLPGENELQLSKTDGRMTESINLVKVN